MAAEQTKTGILLLLTAFAVASAWGQDFFSLENRWRVRDYFTAVYPVSEGVEMNWDGNYDTGEPGSVSAGWLEAIQDRIVFFRRMAGVPDDLSLSAELNRKAQAAAFLLSVNWDPQNNGNIDPHNPPETWRFYTEGAAEATSRSNIGFGVLGAAAVTDYIDDFGPSNHWVGHRRWLLYPQTTLMGAGDTPGDPSAGYGQTNAIYVIGTPETRETRPETRDEFVAWPPPGHVPAKLVFARWSFSHPQADFSEVEINMELAGQPVPLRREPLSPPELQIGEPTVVWVPDGFETARSHLWPAPPVDETVTVTIENVLLQGEARTFSYDVTIFDPEHAGPEEFPAAIDGPVELLAGERGSFTVSSRPWAEASQLRVLRTSTRVPRYDAESGTLPFTANLSPGYAPRQSERVANGTHAFHLVTPLPEDQVLLLPGEYLVGGEKAFVHLRSSLGYATQNQIAAIELNPDGTEGGWIEVWSLRGTEEPAKNDRFEEVSVDVSAFRGKVLRLRLRYYKEPGNFFNQTDTDFGWAIDDLHLENLLPVENIESRPEVDAGEPHRISFANADQVYLQARDIAFGDVPLAWGPARELIVQNADGPVVRPGEWAEDEVLGYLKGSSTPAWGYSAFMGWTYLAAYPWMFVEGNWYYAMAGNARQGLWLYRPDQGYLLANAAYGGWFQLAPYDNSLWSRFSVPGS